MTDEELDELREKVRTSRFTVGDLNYIAAEIRRLREENERLQIHAKDGLGGRCCRCATEAQARVQELEEILQGILDVPGSMEWVMIRVHAALVKREQ